MCLVMEANLEISTIKTGVGMTGTFVSMTLAHWMALYNDNVVMLQDPDEHQRRLISIAQLLRAHDEIDVATFVEWLEKETMCINAVSRHNWVVNWISSVWTRCGGTSIPVRRCCKLQFLGIGDECRCGPALKP